MAEKWFRDSRHRDEFYTDKNYQKAVLRENEELLQKAGEIFGPVLRDVALSTGTAGALGLAANASKIGKKAIEPYAMNDPRGKVPLLPDGPQVNADYQVTRGKPGAPHQEGPKIAVRRASPPDSEPDAPRKPGVNDIKKLVGVKRSFFDQAIWPHNAGLQKAKEVKSDPSDDSDPAEQHSSGSAPQAAAGQANGGGPKPGVAHMDPYGKVEAPAWRPPAAGDRYDRGLNMDLGPKLDAERPVHAYGSPAEANMAAKYRATGVIDNATESERRRAHVRETNRGGDLTIAQMRAMYRDPQAVSSPRNWGDHGTVRRDGRDKDGNPT
jgi:hypothetical protein